MLYIILFLAIIVLLGAVLASKAGQSNVNVLAVQESLKRNHPNDPLSQLGPNEFEAAYMRASRKRNGAISMYSMLGAVAGFVPGLVLGLALIEDNLWVATGLMIGLFAIGLVIGRSIGRNRTSEVFDLIRQDLHLA